MARIVSLSGGSPWGMAISGGKDFGSRVQVTKVTPKGKAMLGGVQLGYYILEVNGTDLDGLTHHQVQNLIRTAGNMLTLKITNEQPKGGAAAPRTTSPTPRPTTPEGGRPRPPPPPAATSPTGSTSPKSVGSTPSARPSGSTPSPRPSGSIPSPRPPGSTPSPRPPAPTTTPTRPHPNPPATAPQKHTATYYQEPARAEDSKIVPDSGLSTYVQSTQQSPAFKKLHPESPAAFSPGVQQQRHSDDVDSASHQMKNVVIEEGSVKKTSQRPGPPPASPANFTTTTMRVASNTGPKQPAVAKPAPPPSVSRPQPPPSVSRPQPPPSSARGGLPSGSTTPVSPSAKITSRQGVCEACQQPIRGPYASAMGKTWHTEHFICYRCNKQLHDTTFVFEDDKIFCDSCYENKVAQNCFLCKRPIVGPMISAANRYYHRQCFRCCRCSADLGQQEGFNMENNQLFCQDCFTNSFGATCFACRQKISANDLWVEAMDQTWHPHCFVCDGCGCTLEGGKFLAKAGRPFCGRCC